MIPTADQFAGSLIGQCVGDALGFLVEGESPEVCARYAREVVLAGRVPPGSHGGFAFGQYSDDSQLARELLLSLVARRGFDPEDYGRRIAALFTENRVVGRGRSTTAAAMRLAAGVPWEKAGTPPPSAGNGSAMRAGPVGLVFGFEPAMMARVARDQGRITHADERCSAGALTVAGAVALAARRGRIDPPLFLQQLQDWAQRIEPTMTSSLRQLADWLDLPEHEAAERISRSGLPPGVDSHWQGGISAFVIASVLWALYAFLRSPDDYIRTIATAIMPGGDVDTTAAMAGAMAGARLGAGAVPSQLADRLNDQGEWRRDDLQRLAEQAHALTVELAGRSR